MKVLVVGGCGYVGGYLVDVLQDKCYDVTVYDNLLYENYYLKDVKFIFGDIRDTIKLSGIINNYDIVIWLAAIVGDGACAVDPKLTYEINTEPVKWLVDNYRGKIIFMSTASVYGINHELIDEDAIPNPLSVYASTKLEAEQYITKNHDNYLIFRLGTVFGQSDMFSRIRFDLVANILTLKAVKGEPLSIFGGEQWRPLLHVKDVGCAIIHCIQSNISGLYNLSYGNFKICDIGEVIQQYIPNTTINYSELSFEDMRNYKVKNDRIVATGWKPMFNLKYGIIEIAKIVRENRTKNPYDSIYYNVNYIKENFG
jgi:nucleoside-diphosphate-sugar epimerase